MTKSSNPIGRLRGSFLPALVLLAAGAIWYRSTELKIARASDDLGGLRTLAEERSTLQERVDLARRLKADPGELARRRQDRLELLSLRGEMADLRRAASQSPEQARAEAESLGRETHEASREAEVWEARMKSEDEARESAVALQQGVILMRTLLSHSAGVLPSSWVEVDQILKEPWSTDEARRGMLVAVLDGLKRGPLTPEGIELLPVPGSLPWKDKAALAGKLVLRERQPRALPDGGWARGYAFLDGRFEEATSPDGDFTAWEKRMTR